MERSKAGGGLTRRTLLGSGAALLAGGCSTGRDPDALRFWGMSYEGDYAPHLTTSFTARTGIRVETQSLPWTAAHEKLLTAYAGGSLPDVLMLPNGWVGEFQLIGALSPVRDPLLVRDVFPGTRDLTRIGGKDWAVPWSVAPQGQFFRRDILAAADYPVPPADWQGWRRMGLALKRRRPDDFVVLMYLNWWDALFTFAGQCGPVLRERETRGNFRSPEFRAALSFYKSLFDDGLAPRALSTEIQDPVGALAQGLFAIYPSGPALFLDLRRRSAELPPERWATARMPGPQGFASASFGSGSLTVPLTTRRADDAWALVRHMTTPANELRFQRMIGSMPARIGAWSDPQLQTAKVRPFAEQLRQPGRDYRIPEWQRIREDVQLLAERVVRGLMSEAEGVTAMDARVDRILAKRRELVQAGAIA